MGKGLISQILDERFGKPKGLLGTRFREAGEDYMPVPTAGDYLPDIHDWPEPDQVSDAIAGLCRPSHLLQEEVEDNPWDYAPSECNFD